MKDDNLIIDFLKIWQKDILKIFKESNKKKDAVILVNEIELGVADVSVYDRTEFINWLSESASPPKQMISILSSPAHVSYAIDPEKAFWVIATTTDGNLGCFSVTVNDEPNQNGDVFPPITSIGATNYVNHVNKNNKYNIN
jgi:hypothetical protein